jgi:hypothetical protein
MTSCKIIQNEKVRQYAKSATASAKNSDIGGKESAGQRRA